MSIEEAAKIRKTLLPNCLPLYKLDESLIIDYPDFYYVYSFSKKVYSSSENGIMYMMISLLSYLENSIERDKSLQSILDNFSRATDSPVPETFIEDIKIYPPLNFIFRNAPDEWLCSNFKVVRSNGNDVVKMCSNFEVVRSAPDDVVKFCSV